MILEDQTFSEALEALKKGMSVYRDSWNGKGQYLLLQVTTPESKMTKSYIYITTVHNDLVPWVASQMDLLADDWVITEAPRKNIIE